MRSTARHLRRPLVRAALGAAAGVALAALAACDTLDRANSTLYPVPQVSAAEMVAANTTQAEGYRPVQNGSIYQAQQYRPLMEDHRARLVGDILTINIAEKLSATQSATSTIDKSGKISGSVTNVPFVSPSFLTKLTTGGSTENSSSGKGQTQNVNDFSGVITATVVGVLPNGHLLVRGEKQVGVNQNVDTLQFTGQVDPQTIGPGNVVQSTQVANVRVQQSGRGAQADAQAMGWLSRFFLNLLPV
jgi:flagellar L-ring protein precursor FlgH